MFAGLPDTAAVQAAPPTGTGAPGGDDRLLTPAQIVERIPGVSERQIIGWIRRGLLEGTHPAWGVWLVTESAYHAWLAAGQPRRVPTERAEPPRPPRLEPQRDRMPRASRRRRNSTELDLSIPA